MASPAVGHANADRRGTHGSRGAGASGGHGRAHARRLGSAPTGGRQYPASAAKGGPFARGALTTAPIVTVMDTPSEAADSNRRGRSDSVQGWGVSMDVTSHTMRSVHPATSLPFAAKQGEPISRLRRPVTACADSRSRRGGYSFASQRKGTGITLAMLAGTAPMPDADAHVSPKRGGGARPSRPMSALARSSGANLLSERLIGADN
eukprot:6185394-Pleurochrysis_carterae.AAC.1